MSAAEAEVRFRITGPAFFFELGIRGSAKEQWCPQPPTICGKPDRIHALPSTHQRQESAISPP